MGGAAEPQGATPPKNSQAAAGLIRRALPASGGLGGRNEGKGALAPAAAGSPPLWAGRSEEQLHRSKPPTRGGGPAATTAARPRAGAHGWPQNRPGRGATAPQPADSGSGQPGKGYGCGDRPGHGPQAGAAGRQRGADAGPERRAGPGRDSRSASRGGWLPRRSKRSPDGGGRAWPLWGQAARHRRRGGQTWPAYRKCPETAARLAGATRPEGGGCRLRLPPMTGGRCADADGSAERQPPRAGVGGAA